MDNVNETGFDQGGDGGDADGFRFTDYGQRLTVATVQLLVAVVGTLGNSLVVLAVCLSRRLRTTTNAFVVSLSLADLLTCLVLPANAASLLDGDLASPLLPGWLCKAVALVLYVCGGCSLFSLAAIALNRWALVTRPAAAYRRLFSTGKVRGMVAATWAVPVLVASLPPGLGLGELGYAEKYGSCGHKTSHPYSHLYSLLQALVFYPAPLIIITVCYVQIFRFVRRHSLHLRSSSEKHSPSSSSSSSSSSPSSPAQKSAGTADVEARCASRPSASTQPRTTSRRQIAITKNLFLVVVAFVVCVTPFAVALMIPPSDPFVPWAATLLLLNSCVNPFIYATRFPHFKAVFRAMLRCRLDEARARRGFVRQGVLRRR